MKVPYDKADKSNTLSQLNMSTHLNLMFSHIFINTITGIEKAHWNELAQGELFCRYEWLAALEQSHCVCAETGWQPQHLIIYQQGKLVAIIPGYIKAHSYGEYVFDWAWAEAYQQHQVPYYPKWLSGIPFTPVTGKRILTYDLTAELSSYIQEVLKEAMHQYKWSSTHINFLNQADAFKHSMLIRHSVQFHWHNKQFHHFDDYLNAMTARKRKMIKKERKQISAQPIQIQWLSGDQITKQHMLDFFKCYQQTYLKRSGHHGYLNLAFFDTIKTTLSNAIHLCVAFKDDTLIAASLYFSNDETLYGRYWGSLTDEHQYLHFELCYYQGIEYAISQKLKRFDAGAQGEHKLARGFEPILTYSAHQIDHPQFSFAIKDFIAREREHIAHYAQQCRQQLPFKNQ